MFNLKNLGVFFVGLAVILVLFLVYTRTGGSNLTNEITSRVENSNVQLNLTSDRAKISLEDLQQGCPVKDCIPSIDDPVYLTVEEADSELNPNDRIFGVSHNGEAKAFPQRIMNWHEIVNTFMGDTPVAITFCPLCGTAETFVREVNGEIAEFGVSGKLYNSDLVMYDRNEGSLWQQITGEAIIGVAAQRDEKLEKSFNHYYNMGRMEKRISR